MPKWVVHGIALFLVVGLADLALSQQVCPQSTVTINPFLTSFEKGPTSTVVYVWTGAHFDSGSNKWKHRSNPTDTIAFNRTGGRVSQGFSSAYSHGTKSDKSTASASAECKLPDCTTATLITSACITSKVDSVGAGAYARAGTTVPAKSSAAKTGIATLNIPNRMTLYSNVGDEAGVWGLVVSVEKVPSNMHKDKKGKSLLEMGNDHPAIAPFLVELLGLKRNDLFKVHKANQRTEAFAVGFELDPKGTTVKVIEHDSAMLTHLTDDQKAALSTTTTKLNELRDRFKIIPCPAEGIAEGTLTDMPLNENCHVAEYSLDKGEEITIEVPYEFELQPKTSKKFDHIIYVETALGGRDYELTKDASSK